MFNRFVVVLIVFSMMLLPGISLADEQKGEVMELSLEECIELAYENNPDMKIARNSLEKADVEYDRMKRQYDDYKDEGGIFNTYDEKLGMETGMAGSEMALTLAEEGLKHARLGIKLAVEAQYYAALQAQDEVEINLASLKRAQEQLRISRLQYEAGRVAKKDVLDAEAAVSRAQAQYNASLRNRDIAFMKLKEVINIPLEQIIKLTSSLKYDPIQNIKLEQDIEYAMQHKFEVVKAREELKLARESFEVANNVYAPNVYEYRVKQHELREKEIGLEKAIKTAKVQIMEAFYNMKSAQESIPAFEKSLAAAKESLRLAKLQYKAGLIRTVDVMGAEKAVKELELEVSRAIHNYNLAKAQYFKAVGREFGYGNQE